MDHNGWDDIGYSFLIGGDGNVYEGRGWKVQGAHTLSFNTVAYGTCFIGDFMETLPEGEAINAYFHLIDVSTACEELNDILKIFIFYSAL